jgi:hypothetical protein
MSDKHAPHDLYGCNHHHPITPDQEIVDFGTGPFVADKALIPLLLALNEAGLQTRTHNHQPGGVSFLSIMLDDARLEVRQVFEADAGRDRFDGRYEVLLSWRTP